MTAKKQNSTRVLVTPNAETGGYFVSRISKPANIERLKTKKQRNKQGERNERDFSKKKQPAQFCQAWWCTLITSTRKAKGRKSGVEGQPWLHNKIKASLGWSGLQETVSCKTKPANQNQILFFSELLTFKQFSVRVTSKDTNWKIT